MTAVDRSDVIGKEGDFALGGILGEPIGITSKYWLDREHAVDGLFGYSFSDFIILQGDYLWELGSDFLEPGSFTRRTGFYVGIGGGFRFSTKDEIQRRKDDVSAVEIFLRVPGGLEWRPVDTLLGFYAELAPGLKVIPGLAFLFQAGIGARYYF